MRIKLEVRIALTVLELLLTGPQRAHTQTHRHTSNENSISAIRFVHLAGIINYCYYYYYYYNYY